MKRLFKRYIKRTFVEFSADGYTFIGIATNFSERGLFIRSQHSFKPGVIVSITMNLPDGKVCNLKGVVKYSRKKILLKYLNGMGIELLERDATYNDYVKTLEKKGILS